MTATADGRGDEMGDAKKGDQTREDGAEPSRPAPRRVRSKWPPQRIAVMALLLALLALVIYLKVTGVV